jgi:hypothetical protein
MKLVNLKVNKKNKAGQTAPFLAKRRNQTRTETYLKQYELHIPGIAGLATFLAAFLLLIKGYRPRALFSLDMPSNFINFRWGARSLSA